MVKKSLATAHQQSAEGPAKRIKRLLQAGFYINTFISIDVFGFHKLG